MNNINEIPPRDRPREKLLANGASSLRCDELLAVILGSGGKGCGVLSLAKKVLELIDQKNGSLTHQHLLEIPGIGLAKASLISAALEFARRRIRPEGVRIREAKDVLPLLQHLADRKQEHFIVISLNGAYEVIATRIVTVGLVNLCQIHPREVFSDPISDRACAVIVAHNHPSGELKASTEDLEVTKRLRSAGDILGIKVLDHIIFSKRGFISLQEHGL